MESRMSKWIFANVLICLLMSGRVAADAVSIDYASRPPLLNQSSPPLVMLVMSVDQRAVQKGLFQLF